MSITSKNFFIASTAVFINTEEPDRPADFISESGSSYWIDNDILIRKSNHWGGVAFCKWDIINTNLRQIKSIEYSKTYSYLKDTEVVPVVGKTFFDHMHWTKLSKGELNKILETYKNDEDIIRIIKTQYNIK